MNILSWNSRGGGGSLGTVHDLESLVQANSPNIVFLCETRQSKDQMKRYRSRLGSSGFDAADSIGGSGGLAFFWHESLYLEIKSLNERYNDAHVRATVDDPPWRLT